VSGKTVSVLGYAVSARGLRADVDYAWSLFTSGAVQRFIACANPHSLVTAQVDSEFASALRYADLLLPDGVGILVAGALQRSRFPERVSGSDLFATFSERANREGGVSYAFLGSSRSVLDRILARLAVDYPNIRVAAEISPPYKEAFSADENVEMIRAINLAQPDVLWVGMTAPKQEKWILQHRARLDVKLIGAIGAVFDFYAGTKKRAPQWVCDLGFEWLPRLVREPRRLWRRNFVSSPRFLVAVLEERFRS
jgi:N-acetylglucosaminyldiphosphoundecaprenol N-acetyl-beta-D-mannosaminyltransferase